MDKNIKMTNQTAGFYAAQSETAVVLRNTYALLGLTLLFSGFCAWMSIGVRPMSPVLMLIGSYGLLFAIQYFKTSPVALPLTFAFTGVMGYGLGPLLGAVLRYVPNGQELIMLALSGTGLTFFALSAYAMNPARQYRSWGPHLVLGTWAVLFCAILGLFFQMPMLQLVISGAIVLLSSGWIMLITNEIVQGGERNYVLATVSLYIQLYNLFVSILQILISFTGDSSSQRK